MVDQVDIGIIGGTGVYDSGLLTDAEQVEIYTPYGATSGKITVGTYAGKRVAFLGRHGDGHRIPPSKVPYRANIWALKELGVTKIISPRAVGGLHPETKPGDLVVSDQFIDQTKSREYTFYTGGQVCHISTAEPFCSELRKLAIETLDELGVCHHKTGTEVCIEGPRFSTRAESIYFRDALKADVIGMTLVPECILAREKEICFLSIAMVTDYDAWSDEPVDNAMVLRVMQKNLDTIRSLLLKLLPRIPEGQHGCGCGNSLENALM